MLVCLLSDVCLVHQCRTDTAHLYHVHYFHGSVWGLRGFLIYKLHSQHKNYFLPRLFADCAYDFLQILLRTFQAFDFGSRTTKQIFRLRLFATFAVSADRCFLVIWLYHSIAFPIHNFHSSYHSTLPAVICDWLCKREFFVRNLVVACLFVEFIAFFYGKRRFIFVVTWGLH